MVEWAPSEIWEQVFHLVDPPAQLCHVLRVCHTFCELAKPIMYREVIGKRAFYRLGKPSALMTDHSLLTRVYSLKVRWPLYTMRMMI
jgi:hypothetical protein